MTTYYWAKPTNGSWNTASKWTPTGGPRIDPEEYLPITGDGAEFSTGSTRTYTVSGKGLTAYTNVVGDHVTFSHFSAGMWGPSSFGVFGGAVVSIAADSWLTLSAYDNQGGYASVDGSKLTVHGRIDLGNGWSGFDITNGSSVTVSGTGASVGYAENAI